MLTLAKIFGQSPFSHFMLHMEKVSLCVDKLKELIINLESLPPEKIEDLCKEVSHLEHEADLVKDYLRNHLPTTTFLPFDRWQLLDILATQDDIADKAEHIAKILILKPSLEPLPTLMPTLQSYFDKNFEAFLETREVIGKLDSLLEVGFGGAQAKEVLAMIAKVRYRDHESALMRKQLLTKFLTIADNLPQSSFWIWSKVIEEIGELAHTCERLVNRIRMILDV